MRLDELNEEALDSRSSIPLPSRESVLRLAAALVVVLLLGCGAFLLAWLDQTLGIILAAVGVGMAVTASALIYTRKLDEGYGRLFGMMFVPLYDWYYMITNLSVYSRWLWLKYTGIAIAFGAMWGLAMHK